MHRKTSYPFRFNSTWLEENQFCALIAEKWKSSQDDRSLSHLFNINNKLDAIRLEIKQWELHKKLEDANELLEFDGMLEGRDLKVGGLTLKKKNVRSSALCVSGRRPF